MDEENVKKLQQLECEKKVCFIYRHELIQM